MEKLRSNIIFLIKFVSAGSGVSVLSIFQLRCYVGGSIKRSCHPPWRWRTYSLLLNRCPLVPPFASKNSRYQLIKISSPVQPRASGAMHHSQQERKRVGFFTCQEEFDSTSCIFRLRWNFFKYCKLPVEPSSWREMLSVLAVRKGSIKVQESHTKIQPGTFQYKQEWLWLNLWLFHVYLRCPNISCETV